jgi:Predicted membrane protein
MTNPFDPRTVLLAKHAQHVVLIHFPIALYISAVAFDFIARWTKRSDFRDAAYFNFLIAALSTLPVLATGLLAWRWALEGKALKGILLLHLVLACLSTVVIWLVWRLRLRSGSTQSPAYLLALEVFGVALIALTGHLGGFLSGVNVPG